jgi:hypothetical protein
MRAAKSRGCQWSHARCGLHPITDAKDRSRPSRQYPPGHPRNQSLSLSHWRSRACHPAARCRHKTLPQFRSNRRSRSGLATVIIASVVALGVGIVGGSDDTGTTAAPEATRHSDRNRWRNGTHQRAH